MYFIAVTGTSQACCGCGCGPGCRPEVDSSSEVTVVDVDGDGDGDGYRIMRMSVRRLLRFRAGAECNSLGECHRHSHQTHRPLLEGTQRNYGQREGRRARLVRVTLPVRVPEKKTVCLLCVPESRIPDRVPAISTCDSRSS
jgi:hypothetical protein